MAVNYQNANFVLYCAKKLGVDLGRTLTLGRQHMFLTKAEAKKLLTSYGFSPSEQEIERFVSADFADDFYKYIGCSALEFLDYSDYENANIIHDLNLPLDPIHFNKYTCVVDGGTVEHIFDFPRVIDNCMKLTSVGGHFISLANANNFLGHGFYQFSPELFYNLFCARNGYKVRKIFLSGKFDQDWYEWPDPEQVPQRIQLVNNERTTVLTVVQRISENAGVLVVPQQSHYEKNWGARKNLDLGKSGAMRKYKMKVAEQLGSLLGVGALHYAHRFYEHRMLRRIYSRYCRKVTPTASSN